jgi:hypothetical protein
MEKARAFFYWIGTPFRAFGNFLRALVNLTRTQMRAIFSLAMLGGIIALSFQNLGLMFLVEKRNAGIESLFGQMALNQQWWNNAIMGGFATILGMVVWGADYLRAKYGGMELEAGDGGKMKAGGAAPIAEAAPVLEDAP